MKRSNKILIIVIVILAGVGLIVGVLALRANRMERMTSKDTADEQTIKKETSKKDGGVDLVLQNGKVATLDDEDNVYEAVAIDGNEIVALGTDNEIKSVISDETEVIDLNGKLVTPGLTDSHVHPIGYGRVQKDFVNLRPPEIRTLEDLYNKMEEAVKDAKPGELVIGHGYSLLDDKAHPDISELDRIAPDNPVIVYHTSGQIVVVNTKALEDNNISENTPNPEGGVIGKDVNTGRLNGYLHNYTAIDLIEQDPPTVEDIEGYIKYIGDEFLSHGITSVQDQFVRGRDNIRAYVNLARKDELPFRASIYAYAPNLDLVLQALPNADIYKNNFFKLDGFKIAVDGGYAAGTAYTTFPYGKGGTGSTLHTEEELNAMVAAIHDAGYNVSMHAVGDAAIDQAITAVELAEQQSTRKDARHRIEHLIITEDSFKKRMADAGIIASMQPSWIDFYGDGFIEAFGKEREDLIMPIKSFVDNGVKVVFGSDVPATLRFEPQYALYGATARETSSGVVMAPEERVTILEALKMHASIPPYASYEEDKKGTIEEGKWADIVVWNDDILEMEGEEILDAEVEITVLDGEIVYESN